MPSGVAESAFEGVENVRLLQQVAEIARDGSNAGDVERLPLQSDDTLDVEQVSRPAGDQLVDEKVFRRAHDQLDGRRELPANSTLQNLDFERKRTQTHVDRHAAWRAKLEHAVPEGEVASLGITLGIRAQKHVD